MNFCRLGRIAASVSYLTGIAVVSVTVFGCQRNTAEFALPPGDVKSGKQAFVHYRCNDCHTIADIEHTGIPVADKYMGKETTGQILVELGGQTPRYRTQAELVAAIINPSHKISTSYSRHQVTTQSPMRNYNDAMTVQNLIDLVEFLQAEYKVTPPRLIYKEYRPPASG